jgi:hypothetical protein
MSSNCRRMVQPIADVRLVQGCMHGACICETYDCE